MLKRGGWRLTLGARRSNWGVGGLKRGVWGLNWGVRRLRRSSKSSECSRRPSSGTGAVAAVAGSMLCSLTQRQGQQWQPRQDGAAQGCSAFCDAWCQGRGCKCNPCGALLLVEHQLSLSPSTISIPCTKCCVALDTSPCCAACLAGCKSASSSSSSSSQCRGCLHSLPHSPQTMNSQPHTALPPLMLHPPPQHLALGPYIRIPKLGP